MVMGMKLRVCVIHFLIILHILCRNFVTDQPTKQGTEAPSPELRNNLNFTHPYYHYSKGNQAIFSTNCFLVKRFECFSGFAENERYINIRFARHCSAMTGQMCDGKLPIAVQ